MVKFNRESIPYVNHDTCDLITRRLYGEKKFPSIIAVRVMELDIGGAICPSKKYRLFNRKALEDYKKKRGWE